MKRTYWALSQDGGSWPVQSAKVLPREERTGATMTLDSQERTEMDWKHGSNKIVGCVLRILPGTRSAPRLATICNDGLCLWGGLPAPESAECVEINSITPGLSASFAESFWNFRNETFDTKEKRNGGRFSECLASRFGKWNTKAPERRK